MQELLTRFFFDIDEPIVAHGGEVHAYVGDEVDCVLAAHDGGLEGARASICFFAVKGPDRGTRGGPYRYEFGSVPRFRAGPCTRARWSSANAGSLIPESPSPILATR